MWSHSKKITLLNLIFSKYLEPRKELARCEFVFLVTRNLIKKLLVQDRTRRLGNMKVNNIFSLYEARYFITTQKLVNDLKFVLNPTKNELFRKAWES